MLTYRWDWSMRKILVMTSAYVLPYVQTLGKGEGSPRATRRAGGGGKCHLFLAGNRAALLGNQRNQRSFLGRKSHDHRRFWKGGLLQSLSLFSKTIIRRCRSLNLKKKTVISINGKKKFKRTLSCRFGGRRKVQVTKFDFQDFSFVVFWCELG